MWTIQTIQQKEYPSPSSMFKLLQSIWKKAWTFNYKWSLYQAHFKVEKTMDAWKKEDGHIPPEHLRERSKFNSNKNQIMGHISWESDCAHLKVKVTSSINYTSSIKHKLYSFTACIWYSYCVLTAIIIIVKLHHYCSNHNY